MSAAPLRFGRGNAKLDPAVYTFSLPAGHACPFAHACLSRADRRTGRVADGPAAAFRCYAATMEARHPTVRAARWHNWDLLRRCRGRRAMTRLVLDSLSPFAGVVRVHDSGDFYSQAYFDAWVAAARARPRTVFYFYTKALPFWARRLAAAGTGHTPGAVPNLVPTASWGGTHDRLIGALGLRAARVVYSAAEAAALGLGVDHDDGLAMAHGPDFALLVHGQQPAGSLAAAAVRTLRDGGWSGYGSGGKRPLPVL